MTESKRSGRNETPHVPFDRGGGCGLERRTGQAEAHLRRLLQTNACGDCSLKRPSAVDRAEVSHRLQARSWVGKILEELGELCSGLWFAFLVVTHGRSGTALALSRERTRRRHSAGGAGPRTWILSPRRSIDSASSLVACSPDRTLVDGSHVGHGGPFR